MKRINILINKEKRILFTINKVHHSINSSNKSNTNSNNSKFDLFGIVIFTGISIGTGLLGIWQLQRYQEKVNLLKDNKSKLVDEFVTVPLSNDLTSQQLLDWIKKSKGYKTTIQGYFEHERECLLGLRSRPPDLGEQAQGLATNPQGYHVITPFRTLNGFNLFVNRGWIPKNSKSWDRPDGIITLNGVVSGSERKTMFSPINVPSSRVLLWLEDKAILDATQSTNISEPVVLVDAIRNDGLNVSFPLGRSNEISEQHYVTPATHMVYAITWFSLSAAGFIMTYYNFRKNPNRTIQKIKKI